MATIDFNEIAVMTLNTIGNFIFIYCIICLCDDTSKALSETHIFNLR